MRQNYLQHSKWEDLLSILTTNSIGELWYTKNLLRFSFPYATRYFLAGLTTLPHRSISYLLPSCDSIVGVLIVAFEKCSISLRTFRSVSTFFISLWVSCCAGLNSLRNYACISNSKYGFPL